MSFTPTPSPRLSPQLSPKLSPKLSQRLAMTPQLRQAIGLLSMDNRDLGAALRRASDTNPCIGLRLPAAGPIAERLAAEPAGLAAEMARQIRLCFDRAADLHVAFALLDALEPWGWLGRSVPEIARGCGHSPAAVETVLARMQAFEPAGIFARDLSECLALQAADRGLLDPVMRGLLARLDLVAAARTDDLARICACEAGEIAKRLAILRRLDPKPGLRLQAPVPPQAAPDLLIARRDRRWRVTLNPASQPDIRVLPGLDAEARREADRLCRAVARRNGTALAIARQIVARQARFLDGAAHPAPLTLSRLAAAARRHESTVSRVTAALTARTPRGVMPLRALLGRGLRGSAAAIAVAEFETRIKALIQSENPARPMSDARLTEALSHLGIPVRRRTVAKYRAALGFPPAHERRRRAGRDAPGQERVTSD